MSDALRRIVYAVASEFPDLHDGRGITRVASRLPIGRRTKFREADG